MIQFAALLLLLVLPLLLESKRFRFPFTCVHSAGGNGNRQRFMEPEEEEITTRAARRNLYAFSSPRVRSASFQFAFFSCLAGSGIEISETSAREKGMLILVLFDIVKQRQEVVRLLTPPCLELTQTHKHKDTKDDGLQIGGLVKWDLGELCETI